MPTANPQRPQLQRVVRPSAVPERGANTIRFNCGRIWLALLIDHQI
jgi:hypothetical protein